MLSRTGRYSLAALSVASIVVPGGSLNVARADHFFHHHGHGFVTTQKSSIVTTGSTLVAPQAAFLTTSLAVPQVTTTHFLVPQVAATQLMVPQVAATQLMVPQFTGFVTTPSIVPLTTSSPSVNGFTSSSTQVSPTFTPHVFTMNPDGVAFPNLANLLRGDPLGLHNLKQTVSGAIAARKGDLGPDSPGRAAAITAIEDIALQALAGSVPGAGVVLGNADLRGEVELFVNQLVLKVVGKGSPKPPASPVPTPVEPTPAPPAPPITPAPPGSNRVDIYIHIVNEVGTKPASPTAPQ
jgi:hypothetical protein